MKLQQSTAMSGAQNVLVSPSFFKIELPKRSIVISGAAPSWKIVTRNTRSKLFCETPISEFKASYITTSMELHLTELGLFKEIASKKRLSKLGEFSCADYPLTSVDRSFSAFNAARSTRLRVLDDTKMPPAAGRVLKLVCGFASISTNQIPLELDVVTREGMLDRFLHTVSITRVQNVKADSPSTDYKRVPKEADVLRDQQMQDDIKDMLDASSPKTK